MRNFNQIVFLAAVSLLAGCLSGESSGTDESNAFVPPSTSNSAPSISGTPPTSVMVTESYSFTPTASDPDGDALSFSVGGLPGWASFDADTGSISGTPMGGDEDVYRNIMITVSDGTSSDSLAPFDIEVLPFGTTEPPPPPPTNSPPTISGTPASSVIVNTEYTFTPNASDPDGDSLSFSIEFMPSWAGFDTVSGTLSGTPQPGDENIYEGIVIRVTDGELTDSLGPFSIEVTPAGTGTGSATLSWTAPSQNEDGSTLNDLAGFKLYWGTSPGSYPDSVTIDNPTVTTFTVEGLASGTYEFVATAYNEAGVESSFSTPASKVVP